DLEQRLEELRDEIRVRGLVVDGGEHLEERQVDLTIRRRVFEELAVELGRDLEIAARAARHLGEVALHLAALVALGGAERAPEPFDGPHEITRALAVLGDAPVGPARLVPLALELGSLGGSLEDGLRQLEARHGERLLGGLAELLEGRRGATAAQREEP